MVLDFEFSADPEERIPRAERRLCSLQKSASVAEIFIRIAERKALALEAGEETEGTREALDVFTQASRILHVSVALQPRVEKELAALRAGDPLAERTPWRASSGDPPRPEPDRMDERDTLRGNILQLVQPESFDEDECDRIYRELDERLFETERYDDFLDLPMQKAVDAICKDLGIEIDWEPWERRVWPPWVEKKRAPEPTPASAPDAKNWRQEDALAPAGIPPHPPP